jgi:membrane protein YdbS with pleckstrin-like domain
LFDTGRVNNDSSFSIATEPLPPSVRKLWRLSALVSGFVLAASSVALAIALDNTLVIPLGLGVAVVVAAGRLLVVDAQYRQWRWGLDERWIERRSGVISRTTQVVPRSRVQTVTTRTGPLDRWLGLRSVTVHTAGTHTPNLSIPHLDDATAERIRTELGG